MNSVTTLLQRVYLNNIQEEGEEGLRRHGGDIVSLASEKLMTHFHRWQDMHENNRKAIKKIIKNPHLWSPADVSLC